MVARTHYHKTKREFPDLVPTKNWQYMKLRIVLYCYIHHKNCRRDGNYQRLLKQLLINLNYEICIFFESIIIVVCLQMTCVLTLRSCSFSIAYCIALNPLNYNILNWKRNFLTARWPRGHTYI